jgi:hypothetical protein
LNDSDIDPDPNPYLSIADLFPGGTTTYGSQDATILRQYLVSKSIPYREVSLPRHGWKQNFESCYEVSFHFHVSSLLDCNFDLFMSESQKLLSGSVSRPAGQIVPQNRKNLEIS